MRRAFAPLGVDVAAFEIEDRWQIARAAPGVAGVFHRGDEPVGLRGSRVRFCPRVEVVGRNSQACRPGRLEVGRQVRVGDIDPRVAFTVANSTPAAFTFDQSITPFSCCHLEVSTPSIA